MQRKTSAGDTADKSESGAETSSKPEQVEKKSSLVFGYLNLFSDGVVSTWLLYHYTEEKAYERLPKKEKEMFRLRRWEFVPNFSVVQHNFTDGMALGSAFLIYGSVGGWSRTIFLLAHELPQEVLAYSAS